VDSRAELRGVANRAGGALLQSGRPSASSGSSNSLRRPPNQHTTSSLARANGQSTGEAGLGAGSTNAGGSLAQPAAAAAANRPASGRRMMMGGSRSMESRNGRISSSNSLLGASFQEGGAQGEGSSALASGGFAGVSA